MCVTAAFPTTDDAFLARQRAKADAEFYTAQRAAEANKVERNAQRQVWSRSSGVELFPQVHSHTLTHTHLCCR